MCEQIHILSIHYVIDMVVDTVVDTSAQVVHVRIHLRYTWYLSSSTFLHEFFRVITTVSGYVNF